jgi:hypothetical protein
MEMWEVDDPIIRTPTDLPIIIPVDMQSENNYLRKIQIDMSKLNGKESVIVLDQAYEEGWIAIEVPNSKFACPDCIGEILNSKIRLLPHVKMNGWANAWQISSAEFKMLNAKLPKDVKTLSTQHSALGTSTIFLVFWPQYLQYAGFVLMGLTLLTLSLKTLKIVQKHSST